MPCVGLVHRASVGNAQVFAFFSSELAPLLRAWVWAGVHPALGAIIFLEPHRAFLGHFRRVDEARFAASIGAEASCLAPEVVLVRRD